MRLNYNLAHLRAQSARKRRNSGGESTNMNARFVKNIRKRRRIGHTSSRQRMPDAPSTRYRVAVKGRTVRGDTAGG